MPRVAKPYAVSGLKRTFATPKEAITAAAKRARAGVDVYAVAVHDTRQPGSVIAICEYWTSQYKTRGTSQRQRPPRGHGKAHARCFIPSGKAAIKLSPYTSGRKPNKRAKRVYDRAFARGTAITSTGEYKRAADAWAYKARHKR